jgi:hypothetical protein
MKQFPYTTHALQRCRNRSIRKEAVDAVLEFGRCRYGRHVEIFTLRGRDVQRWAQRGYELSRFQGIEVICGHDGRVVTVYRKRNGRKIRSPKFS